MGCGFGSKEKRQKAIEENAKYYGKGGAGSLDRVMGVDEKTGTVKSRHWSTTKEGKEEIERATKGKSNDVVMSADKKNTNTDTNTKDTNTTQHK
ncbi:hypothetical protein U5B43_00130 [Campylobacter sp. 9BO]|uniref:hypothetical protein n=1 Tax=Campylobacter sp. 9BO TaxID=3424759 RepID=UPI003D32CD79